MAVVSRGRLLSKGGFPLIAGMLAGVGADAGGVELPEGLGELVAQPLIVLGQFRLRAVVAASRRSKEASLLRWCAGTGVPGARRPRSRSRRTSSRMSGWV